jgi:hypothetical protein
MSERSRDPTLRSARELANRKIRAYRQPGREGWDEPGFRLG